MEGVVKAFTSFRYFVESTLPIDWESARGRTLRAHVRNAIPSSLARAGECIFGGLNI
jgi:hypothetical protein